MHTQPTGPRAGLENVTTAQLSALRVKRESWGEDFLSSRVVDGQLFVFVQTIHGRARQRIDRSGLWVWS